jgi:hypothetical protein
MSELLAESWNKAVAQLEKRHPKRFRLESLVVNNPAKTGTAPLPLPNQPAANYTGRPFQGTENCLS